MAGPEQQRLTPAERGNLVAYLDGELNEAESRAIATKLTQSVTARRELEALEKTWELLDLLPRPAASAELTERTLSMVKLKVDGAGPASAVSDLVMRRLLQVVVLIASAAAALLVGYAATRWVWPNPSARLERDLTLAEHLDEYRDAGSFDFLKWLDESPAFADEVSTLGADPGPTDAQAAEHRLLAMPLEERQRLLKNLERFDRLDRGQQAALRRFDERVRAEPINDRARFYTLLRRYHLWAQGLTDAERNALDSAEGDAKLALAQKYRETDRARKQEAAHKQPMRQALVQAQLIAANQPNGPSLLQTAHLLKTWMHLDSKQQDNLKRLRQPKQFFETLQARSPDLRKDPRFKREIEDMVRYSNRARVSKKDVAGLLKHDLQKAQYKAALRLAEARWFADHEPAKVDQRKLLQFEQAMPEIFRDQIDILPPDAARRRLSILYRYVYPPGQEMPDPAPAAKAEAEGRSSTAPPPPPRPQPPRGKAADASTPF